MRRGEGIASARVFWDVWSRVVESVADARRAAFLGSICRSNLVAEVRERHGERIATAAADYYDKLRADTRSLSEGRQ